MLQALQLNSVFLYRIHEDYFQVITVTRVTKDCFTSQTDRVLSILEDLQSRVDNAASPTAEFRLLISNS